MYYLDLAQIVGFAACFVSLNACMRRDEKLFKLAILTSCLLWAVHNAMLGANMAAILSLVAAVRTALSFDVRNRNWAIVLFGVYLVLSLSDKNSPFDWLPIVATLTGTYSLFYCKGVTLRIVHCFGAPLWIIHDLHYGSIGGVISQSCMLALSIYTICGMLGLSWRNVLRSRTTARATEIVRAV
jgi:hypothetical protein